MTWDQLWVWFLSMFNAPFVVLIAIGWSLRSAIKAAHVGGKLDMANIFKDDLGKESGLRVAMLGAWAISSWYLMADLVVSKVASPLLLGVYLATWSGAPVFVKALEKWDGSVTKSKGESM